ncbi:hypothetical protein Tco_1200540 [Tanacetum coccineum]
MKNSAIELYDEDGNEFTINKQRAKPYQNGVLGPPTEGDDDISLDDERRKSRKERCDFELAYKTVNMKSALGMETNIYIPAYYGVVLKFLIKNKEEIVTDAGDGVRIYPDGVASPATLYLMRRSLEVLRKFHWIILGERFNQLSHISSPLLSKPWEY